MSVAGRVERRLADASGGSTAAARLVGRAVFGDRLGLVVFLAATLFSLSCWRIGFFITDNYTIANTLVGVSRGHLWVPPDVVYGDSPDTPGMHLVDGRLYGRNYGHVLLALPFLWTIEAVAAVADPRVAVAACYSLLLLALATQVGRLVDRRRAFALGGSAVALFTFAANLAVARPLDPVWFPMVALQTSTVVAAGAVAVLLYRLVARAHDRRAGLFAGLAGVLATPVGFWASIPKRHVVVTALTLAALYSLYRSRAGDRTIERRFRPLAYAWVALLAWVHAPEALVVLLALLAVDLPTARANDPRTLATVAAAFGVALLPFLLTNAMVVGTPVEPPRLWPDYAGEPLTQTGGSGGGPLEDANAGTGAGTTTDGGPTGRPDPNAGGGLLGKVSVLLGLLADGAVALVERPSRLRYTFLRSGAIPGVEEPGIRQAINLTVVESAPLLGALCVLPIALGRRLASDGPFLSRRDPTVAADAFAVAVAVGLTLVYLPRLPLHAQVTVRYLLPLFALGVYGVARQAPVRRVLVARGRLVAWTASAGVLLGGQAVFAWLALTDAPLGEAMQFHAWLGLATAGGLAAWLLLDSAGRPLPRVGAVCLGLALAAGANLALLASFAHFADVGVHALPLARALADALAS
ncbi:hypothetical protein ACFQPA_07440 [Halomarina halobia]|uniref:Glycosyltransferase RgtA/B/C/D-like domain-containing protein n=1 Tax=Halomarina halobia TaxID=3033386 RepID=A0ABD6ACG8_9EURY|nr:hypothetical protein [Halomarina sp. PSR21]